MTTVTKLGARLRKVKRLSYLAVISMAAIGAGCSVYDADLLSDGGAHGGAGGTTQQGGTGGTGGSGVGIDASTGGSGGTGDSGGSAGSGGGFGGSGGVGGTAGKGGTGASAGTDAGATGGSGTTGGASGTGGATGGTGGAAGTGGTTGGTGGVSGTGGASGASGSGGATGGASGTGGATGGAGGTGGSTGGTGGAMDAGPEVPPGAGAVFAVGSFTKSGATGSQMVPHTLGQVPKAIILWTIGKTDETMTSGFNYGIGISDPATSVALAMASRDGIAPSLTSRRMANKAITMVTAGEASTTAALAEADMPSWGSTSFTLNWTTNDGQPFVVHYLLIGGPQVSAKVVNWQAPTAAGQKVVPGIGFQPETVLHFHAGAAFISAVPFNQTNAVLGIGAMDKTGAQWGIQVSDANAQSTTVTSRAQRNDAAIFMYTDTGTASVTKQASFVSMNADGFTLNFTTANASASQIYSLALAGLKAGVGTFNKTTATAPALQPVTTGFTPGAVFMTSFQIAAQTATISEPMCSIGLGATDGPHEASSTLGSYDGVTTPTCGGQDKASKAFIKMNMPPLDAEADFASFSASGFSLNWTTSDPVASQICFLALGAP
jgi:hypothetical protein